MKLEIARLTPFPPLLSPGRENLVFEAVNPAELGAAQSAGFVGVEHGGTLLLGRADPPSSIDLEELVSLVIVTVSRS